jgi:hypothetical protein
MNLELDPEQTSLVKVLLLAELEEKRVEMHHAKNTEFKAELLHREKTIQAILEKFK